MGWPLSPINTSARRQSGAIQAIQCPSRSTARRAKRSRCTSLAATGRIRGISDEMQAYLKRRLDTFTRWSTRFGATKALYHDDVGGAGGMVSAVMTLAERQTTGDEVSPDDDRHSNNAGHGDCLDNVRGESGIDNHLLALIRGYLDGVPKSFCSIEKVIQERHGRISIQ